MIREDISSLTFEELLNSWRKDAEEAFDEGNTDFGEAIMGCVEELEYWGAEG